MSLTNGQSLSKETWDSHNKMMLEPLAISDSEVRVQWTFIHIHKQVLADFFVPFLPNSLCLSYCEYFAAGVLHH